uniref:Methenyltetrahydrofolate cyclohydrolase n=1 Tax=Aplanochytrium stocchinoi TaxID=215587 RepID=A0A7S3PFP7_9STRA
MKKKIAKALGFKSIERRLPETATTEEVRKIVEKLNAMKDIDGILVQLPLPDQIDQKYILEAIDIEKDVDGFHSSNFGSLARAGEDLRQQKREFVVEETRNAACTPLGSIVLLERSGVDLNGKNVVVLGRSNIVGLPVALMCLHRNATVTICHSRTKDLEAKCSEADVVIAAIGRPEFVKRNMIKPGATVIDVGINFKADKSRKSGYRMCGDVDFAEVGKVAGAITPVPGGVGPMTVTMLMMNCLNNAKVRMKREAEVAKGIKSYDPAFKRKLEKSPSFAWKYGTSAQEA